MVLVSMQLMLPKTLSKYKIQNKMHIFENKNDEGNRIKNVHHFEEIYKFQNNSPGLPPTSLTLNSTS